MSKLLLRHSICLDPSIVLKGPENVFFYCNQRPINYVKSELKDIVSNIRVRYKDAIGLNVDNNQKIPFIYVDIQIPPSEYDGTHLIYIYIFETAEQLTSRLYSEC